MSADPPQRERDCLLPAGRRGGQRHCLAWSRRKTACLVRMVRPACLASACLATCSSSRTASIASSACLSRLPHVPLPSPRKPWPVPCANRYTIRQADHARRAAATSARRATCSSMCSPALALACVRVPARAGHHAWSRARALPHVRVLAGGCTCRGGRAARSFRVFFEENFAFWVWRTLEERETALIVEITCANRFEDRVFLLESGAEK
jgi:hypothetical protein